MSCPCRERFSGAKGIIYCFSKNDTVVVASFLHVRLSSPGPPVPLCNIHDCRQRQTRSISDAADPLCVRAYIRISISNVCAALQKEGGIKAAAYHGGMTSKDRIRAQNAWQSGHVKVLLLAAHCPKRFQRASTMLWRSEQHAHYHEPQSASKLCFYMANWSRNRTIYMKVYAECLADVAFAVRWQQAANVTSAVTGDRGDDRIRHGNRCSGRALRGAPHPEQVRGGVPQHNHLSVWPRAQADDQRLLVWQIRQLLMTSQR